MQHYVTAWKSNEPEDIRALFTEGAVYATRPDDPEPWTGREQIVERWIAAGDAPGDWTFEWKLLGVDGGRAFVQGRTDYRRGQPQLRQSLGHPAHRGRPGHGIHRMVYAAQVT